MPIAKQDPTKVEILPNYKPNGELLTASEELCTVLHGYGRVEAKEVHYIDNYKFVGGVGRNVPRSIAKHWKNGTRPDGKPAISRVFCQAILPNDSNEIDFAQATGIQPMEPTKLAAMIGASDAQALIEALGIQKTAQLIEELKAGIAQAK